MSWRNGGLLLFDAAGTLIEPAEPVERVYRRYFAEYGWETDEAVIRGGFRQTFAGLADPEFDRHDDGDGAEREWWRRVVERTAVSAGIDPAHANFERCFTGLFDHYAAGGAWKVYPEVRMILSDLRAMGVKMAVVSNFDRRLHRVLEELDLSRWFDRVLTSADVKARKPSPLLLAEAMSRFGCPVERTKLVGDSVTADGGAARAAGIGVFLLDRPETTLVDFVKWLR